MEIEIKKCPSGFYAIFIGGILYYAASPTREAAVEYARSKFGKGVIIK